MVRVRAWSLVFAVVVVPALVVAALVAAVIVSGAVVIPIALVTPAVVVAEIAPAVTAAVAVVVAALVAAVIVSGAVVIPIAAAVAAVAAAAAVVRTAVRLSGELEADLRCVVSRRLREGRNGRAPYAAPQRSREAPSPARASPHRSAGQWGADDEPGGRGQATRARMRLA